MAILAAKGKVLAVRKGVIAPSAIYQIQNMLTFKNPEFKKDPENAAEFLRGWDEDDEAYYFPRVLPIKKLLPPDAEVEDRLNDGDEINITTNIKLEEYQVEPVETMMRFNDGLLIAPCGAGKTVMGIEIIARKGRCALVLVMKEFLMGQWADEVFNFSPDATVGFIGGSDEFLRDFKSNPRVVPANEADIVIATIQTLSKGAPEWLVKRVGLIYGDEAHHAAANSFIGTLKQFKPRHMHGTTATYKRTDGLHNLYRFYTGPVRAEVTQETLRKYGRTVQPKIQQIKTRRVRFIPNAKGFNFQVALTVICADEERNNIILDLAKKAESKGRWTIVLSERVEHCVKLCEAHIAAGGDGAVVTGQIGDMDTAFEHKTVFATLSLVSEGLNQKHLNTVVLATPFSSETRTLQTIGRVVRSCADKTGALVFDLVDMHPTLKRMAEKRRDSMLSQGWNVALVDPYKGVKSA